MRRRDVIALAASAFLAGPQFARAQTERVRRIGMLLVTAENDPAQLANNAAFFERLQALGWAAGRNLNVDVRWGSGDNARIQTHAAELVATAPDAIMVMGNVGVSALRERTSTTPIIFQMIQEPVAQGFVQSLALPGGNMTGLTNYVDIAMGGKWLETLKEITPGMGRILFVDNPEVSHWQEAVKAAARSLSLDLSIISTRDMADLQTAVSAFARGGPGSVVLASSSFVAGRRDAIIAVLAAARLPAIWSNGAFARAGGLISYGPDITDSFRRGADVVDRILRGASPGEIPVQNPIKFELVVNLKTARALGITIPQSVLFRADEVIE